jgi:hypothetical protein
VYCGDGGLGLRGGCVVDVDMRVVGTLDPPKVADVNACIRRVLVGRRWTCALGDGWWHLFLGSCTIP